MSGVGDFQKETFDKDELAVLGEAEEKAPDAEKDEPKKDEGPGTQDQKPPDGEVPPEREVKVETEPKAEPTAEELAAAEDQGFRIETDEKGHTYIIDDDGTKIPPKRFREVYREAKEGERTKEKLDLFKKLGPEGYYRVYPYERPETPPVREVPREVIPSDVDVGGLLVQYEPHIPQDQRPYEGMTLRDVHEVDPVFATNLQTEFLWKQKQDVAVRMGEMNRVRQESATEIETFAGVIAKENFGKSVKELSKDEEGKVVDTIQAVLNFMNNTGYGDGLMDHAYFLMDREGHLKGAANKAAAKTLKDLQNRQGPASINTSTGGEVKGTGFEAYEKMTEAALTAKIDGMNENETRKFFKDAPKSLRAKYPSIPWD